jgi:hypothetical protein
MELRTLISCRITFLLFFYWFPFYVSGQVDISIGEWRSHAAYLQGKYITAGPQRTFVSVENGLFFLDRASNNLHTLSTTEGLSGVSIGPITFIPDTEQLLISYEDGNLDFWSENEIINFTAIKNATLIGSKRINSIESNDGLVYLTADFGVVVIEPQRIEVEESYVGLGSTGENIPILSVAFSTDSIYLGSESEILSASLGENTNREDFNNWERFTIKNKPVVGMANLNGQLYAALEGDSIYYQENGRWKNSDIPSGFEVRQFTSSGDQITITSELGIRFINSLREVEDFSNALIQQPYNYVVINDEEWVSDSFVGAVRIFNEGSEVVRPDGPLMNSIEKLFSTRNETLAVYGGKVFNNPARIPGSFSMFESNVWDAQLVGENVPTFIEDILNVDYDPFDQTYWFSSFGHGIISWDGDTSFTVFDESSPGSTLINLNPEGNFTLVNDLTPDFNGNYWISAVDSVQTTIHFFNGSDNWAKFNFDIPGNPTSGSILYTLNGNIWVVLEENGLLVFDPENQTSRHLTTETGNGGLPSNIINDIAEDRDGQIWVATASGVAAFPFPFNILNSSLVDAFLPIVDGRFLFSGEVVNTLEIDPGNRKLFGTNNGVFIFNETVSQLEQQFNVENSPIFSNTIIDMSVEPISGELFILTPEGLISRRGDATVGDREHRSVKIFPNPVRPDFNGTIGISGLVNSAIVKITDISGKLVREINANGGTATWDGRLLGGGKAGTGVYLVFSSSVDGEETFIGKIAIIE